MPSPATTFQYSVNTSAVAATTVTGVATTSPILEGVLVVISSSASGSVYYGTSNGVTTSTGTLIPNGVPVTIPRGFFQGDLSNLYFIASGATTISGYVL